MIMNVCWRRKDTQIEADPCVIQDVIELSESEYAHFYQNLLDYYDFIAEHQDAMFYRDGQDHALLVLGEHQKDGILVSSEGSNYARYSAFIPNARELIQNDIRQLADYCVGQGLENSEDGSWAVTYEELYYHFDQAAVSNQNGVGKLLMEELQRREEINELIMTEDCIEMTYHMEYCENCQQGGIAGAMNLFSLMGCNLYDVHFEHEEPNFEFPLISSLKQDTLTAEGKTEWSDVLSAEVEKIAPASGCVRLTLTNCDPHRLLAFSEMLNGQCDAEDYERWVRKDGISYAGYGSVPKELPDEKYNADLVATYEELLSVPYQDKVTDYFGDYSLHHFRYGITAEQIEPVYEKALAAMEMTEEEFKQENYLYRGDIVNRMRDCLLAKELRTGEEVLFVATEPYGGEGDFAFRGGLVMAVDAEQKTCKMRGDFFDMENVPLHYVLGRHDMSAGKHYGVDHVQPLFGEHPALAQHYLKEAEEAWNAKWNDGQVQEEESTPALSM